MTKKQPKAVEQYIGGMIRRLRMARGWNQARLGAVLGVSFQQVQKYEAGKNRVAASTLLRIAQVLDFPVLAFLPDHADDPFGRGKGKERGA